MNATPELGRVGAILALSVLALCFLGGTIAAQSGGAPARDLTQQPTLYVVGYAHLDTEWRWEYPQVIDEYLPKTLHLNFDLFQKYPHYIFNFSGSNRYGMMKEYYPADYARMKRYVAAGRWFPAGSSVEEGDVNSPSPESIIRQVLYGNEFFRREFGVASAEYMLPDCFGFPASLPSILAAAGVKGFSTQKLTWGSSAPAGGPGSPEDTPRGTPFNVGLWLGPDGKGVIAALNPGDYSGGISYDLSTSPAPGHKGEVDWPKRVNLDGKVSLLKADYHYYGTGDTGGSPSEGSVKLLEAIVTKARAAVPPPEPGDEDTPPQPAGREVRVGDGPLQVVSSKADQMFLDILKSGKTAGLPRYSGDLELTNHSAGSLTSEAAHKQWNRKNEILADAAERASVAAAWLGGPPYPLERLNNAWRLVMGGQFHDLLAGTATPKSYEYSWNDDVLAMNQFAGALTSAVQAISSGLNTEAQGTAVVVYNPLNIGREDVAEATLSFPGGLPAAVRVTGPDGREVPAQLEAGGGDTAKVVFLARTPSVGFAVYDIRPAEAPSPAAGSALKVTELSLENARYRVRLDENGDVASLFDKQLGRELLSAPARLAFQTERPHDWPAWNMDWADQQKPPRGYVGGPAKIRIVENGPARVAIEVEREAEGSRFVQTIRLAAGDGGNRVEFANAIDWKTNAAALKATFPLTASNPEASYNWGVSTIQRDNNEEKKFEVASHRWFDLTDKSDAYGVTVLSDCKTGSDKPDDSTLRLTLLYTPGLGTGNGRDYADQTTQDWGHHEFVYGLAAHDGDWRRQQTDWQAYRLNEPLIAFESPAHPGALGKSFSFLRVNNSDVRVMAVKKAENSEETVVRVVEMRGQRQANVRLSFAAPLTAAREVDGQEEPLGHATVAEGSIETSLTPYQIRTFAVKIAAAPTKVTAPQSQPVALPYDLAAASDDGDKSEGGFDAAGDALPAEMLPTELAYNGIHFELAPAWTGRRDAMVARGQQIALPPGNHNRVYVLAASAGGDQQATFRFGEQSVEVKVQDWSGFVGQWDTRTWQQAEVPVPPEPAANDNAPAARRARRIRAYVKEHGPIMRPQYTGLVPAFIKPAPVAWFASHHHTADGGNVAYSYAYLFAYSLPAPAGANALTLPDNDKIRILAVTVANEAPQVTPAQPLYDTLPRENVDMARWNAPGEGAEAPE
ncbi:MAG TPA: glycoside hydrolase family 38 C-terminal domain-containing protein [Terriglobia bacterium]|nr:glycoside hydrolase family 38 C-terminal domain-containing protein [Terriglobia bacterium]